MTLAELNTVLLSTGYPVAYGFFPEAEAPALPCITYEVAYSNNFSADSVVYKKVDHVDIFLWTKNKDTSAEDAVENALDGASLYYEKTETYMDSEKAYQIIYETEIMK